MRFRLRTLLLALTAVSFFLAPIAWWRHKTVVQANVADRVEALGARVFYDYQLSNASGRIGYDDSAEPPYELIVDYFGLDAACDVAGLWCPRWKDEQGAVLNEIEDCDVEIFSPLTNLQWLSIDSYKISDKSTKLIESLPMLEDLSLNSPKITDETVDRLVTHRRLTALNLCGTRVSDRGVRTVGKLSQLKVLNLGYTRITGDSLPIIGRLHELLELHLRGNTLTSGRLQCLQGLRKLAILDVRETGVTRSEIDELVAALPQLTVFHESGSLDPSPPNRIRSD